MTANHDISPTGDGLVFIGGAPRSGTTLLQRIMGTHEDVYAGPEFDFIPTDILKLREKMLAGIDSGRVDLIVDEETLDRGFRVFIREIFQTRLAKAGKSVFCEKTPANALVFPELQTMFPDAKHIMVVRDPRDVVNSMKVVRERFIANHQRPPRFVRSIAASVEEVNRYQQAGLSAAEESDNIMVLHYEDLVDEPTQTIRKVCQHVGLPFRPEMLNIEQKRFTVPKSNDDGHWYSRTDLQQPIRRNGIVSGRRVLRPADMALIEKFSVNKPALRKYGLPRGKIGLKDRLRYRISLTRKAGVLLPRRRSQDR